MEIITDKTFSKVVEGIYAGGDCTTPMWAVASGTMAGAVINNDMAAASF